MRLFMITMACIAVSAAVLHPDRLSAQTRTEATSDGIAIQLPPTEAIISISTKMPANIRVGDDFQYEIRIENVSSNIAIHDLILEQKPSDSFRIESASASPSQNRESEKSEQTQKSGQTQQNQQTQQNEQSEQAKRDKSRSEKAPSASTHESANHRWTVEALMPGETRTIQVHAIAEKESRADVCLVLNDFKPSLCLPIEIVKPDLELVKTTPEQVNLCDEIEVSYYVKNVGTGNAGRFVIRDPLGDGLQTIEGKPQLEFAVDGLSSGDTRRFVAKLRASEPGEFASRAVAEMDQGGKTNSNRPTLIVRQGELDLSLQGPSSNYLNRPVEYTVFVANRGNAPVTNAVVRLQFDAAAELMSVGDLQPANMEAIRTTQSSSAQPTQADQPTSTNDGSQAQNDNNESKKPEESSASQTSANSNQSTVKARETDRLIEITRLDPGLAVKIPVIVRFRQPGTVMHRAVAEFYCGDQRTPESIIRAVAQQQTRLLAFPDLLLTVVDNKGTIPSGENVQYTITVKNQGDAADENVRIDVELPEQLQFVSADGPSDAERENQSITFAPIPSLDPGDQAIYRVTARAQGEGEVLFRTKLSSESMQNAATSEEPTRLLGEASPDDSVSNE